MAVGKFSACLTYTLREEGGYSNDAGDPGGVTEKGVTQKTYGAYRARKGLYLRAVTQMSEAELQDIYRTGYWDTVGAEALPAGVDLSTFDYAVNAGPGAARPALARAQSGGAKPATVIGRIASERLSFLHGLRTWRAFGRSWGVRVARIEAASLKMAGQSITPAAAAAKARQKGSAAKAKGASVVIGASAVPAHQIAGGHAWIVAAVIGICAALTAIAAFNAWRQSQRAAALTEAASSLAAETLAAKALAGAAKAAATPTKPPPPAV